MRKLVLALLLALAALTAGLDQAAAMEGFDLGEMPPLPPPLLDDTPNPPSLSPPPSGAASPLIQGGSATAPAAPPLSPLSPPPASGGTDLSMPMPPAPPPLTPPAPDASPSLAPPGGFGDMASTVPAQPVSLNETPLSGKVTGGRVNVRAGPNTQYESIAVLTTGAPITVLAKHGEWYKIVFPADQLASIHKNYVTADITGEIPETGLPGTVNQDNADVHAFYWDRSTVVGKLNRGDPVTIKQERSQWYRIDAPPSARAYVFAEYVRLDNNAPVVADSAPAPHNPAVDPSVDGKGGTGERRLSKDDEKILALKESIYKRSRAEYERQQEEEELAIKEAEERLRKQGTQLDMALKDLDERLKAIDEETGQRMSHMANVYNPVTTIVTTVGSAAWAPPDPAYGGYTGWVENIGRVGGAPASFRLTKGGEIRFFLRSDSVNLDDFVGRRVWLNGAIEPAAGGSAGMLNVDQIRILTELEIAETMQGGAPAYYDTQPQPYYGDPGLGGVTSAPVYQDPYAPQPVYQDPYAMQNVYQSAPAPTTPGSLPPSVGGPQGGIVPRDASQLPDMVGAGGPSYVDPSYGVGSPLGGAGEVETDYYERPVISEIAP